MANPYREGYVCEGWYETEDFSGTKYESIVVAPNEVLLYVNWVVVGA